MKEEFSSLGKQAWALADFVKATDDKLKSGKITDDEWENYGLRLQDMKDEFSARWRNAKNSVMFDEEGSLREEQFMYLSGDNKLLSKEEQSQASPGMALVAGRDAGSNIRSYSGKDKIGRQEFFAENNSKGAWRSVKINDDSEKDEIRKLVLPMASTWISKGLDQWNVGASAVERYDNIKRTTDLVDYALSWVSSHGSPGNPKLKSKASKMLKEMELLDFSAKKSYIEKRPIEFKALIDNMGYHGSKNIYNKFNKEFSDPKYYRGEDLKAQQRSASSSANTIKNRLRMYDEYDKTSKALKAEAHGLVLDDDNMEFTLEGGDNVRVAESENGDMQAMIHKHLLNSAGDRKSFDQVVKTMTQEYGMDGDMIKGAYFKPTQKQFLEDSGTQSIGLMEAGGSTRGAYKTVDGTKNLKYSYAQMKNAYNNMVSLYKDKFGEINVEHVYEYTSMKAGLGYKESKVIGLSNVGLTEDNPKTKNVKKILSIIEGQDLGSDRVYSDRKVYIDPGGYSPTISKSKVKSNLDDEGWTAKKQQQLYDRFFEDGDRFDVEFTRESPLGGKAAYTFVKRGEKDESMTVYIDKNLAHQYDEDFLKKTFTSTSDWSFAVDGTWDMKWAEGKGKAQKAKKLQILNYNGHKYLSGELWNANKGMFENKFADLGASDLLSIKRAEALVQDILSQINIDE
jgi:hypothetical protein